MERNKKNYEKRIVFFIDILGLKEKINSTYNKDGEPDEDKVDKLYEVYMIIRDHWDDDLKECYEVRSSRKVTTFSDSAVISFKYNDPSEIFYVLHDLKELIVRLIHHNVLIRGAGTVGDLIHDDDVIFGNGLRDAYMLEDKAALYPRIIIGDDIIDSIGPNSMYHTKEEEKEHVLTLLTKDLDGHYYIDYFKDYDSVNEPHLDIIINTNKLRDIIIEGLQIKKPEIRVKYLWMKEKFNSIIETYHDKNFLKMIKDYDTEIWEGYMELNSIT